MCNACGLSIRKDDEKPCVVIFNLVHNLLPLGRGVNMFPESRFRIKIHEHKLLSPKIRTTKTSRQPNQRGNPKPAFHIQ